MSFDVCSCLQLSSQAYSGNSSLAVIQQHFLRHPRRGGGEFGVQAYPLLTTLVLRQGTGPDMGSQWGSSQWWVQDCGPPESLKIRPNILNSAQFNARSQLQHDHSVARLQSSHAHTCMWAQGARRWSTSRACRAHACIGAWGVGPGCGTWVFDLMK